MYVYFTEPIDCNQQDQISWVRTQICKLLQKAAQDFEINLSRTSYSLIVSTSFVVVIFSENYLLNLPEQKVEYEPYNFLGFYNLPEVTRVWPETLQTNADQPGDSGNSDLKLFNLI